MVIKSIEGISTALDATQEALDRVADALERDSIPFGSEWPFEALLLEDEWENEQRQRELERLYPEPAEIVEAAEFSIHCQVIA